MWACSALQQCCVTHEPRRMSAVPCGAEGRKTPPATHPTAQPSPAQPSPACAFCTQRTMFPMHCLSHAAQRGHVGLRGSPHCHPHCPIAAVQDYLSSASKTFASHKPRTMTSSPAPASAHVYVAGRQPHPTGPSSVASQTRQIQVGGVAGSGRGLHIQLTEQHGVRKGPGTSHIS